MITFDVEKKNERIKEIEELLSSVEMWGDPKKAGFLNKELSDLKDDINFLERMLRELEDISILNQLAVEMEDETTSKEVDQLLRFLQKEIEVAEIRSLLNQKYDRKDAIISINAGAGGTDACDWVQMLSRMYARWANSKGYEVHITDYTWGDEAGYKSVEMIINGKYSFGFLKAERGVHRLIRLSPFDYSGKRHTSFASVDVIPILEEEEIEIDPKDLRIETFRSSGPGGQHVNVTDSAVRITHIPTGLTAACQEERSQLRNKEMAMLILKAKLNEYYEKERKKQLEKLRGEKKEIAWGNQIRTYTMHAYNLVKDHRTGLEEPRVESVLEGNIDQFIFEFLKHEAKSKSVKEGK